MECIVHSVEKGVLYVNVVYSWLVIFFTLQGSILQVSSNQMSTVTVNWQFTVTHLWCCVSSGLNAFSTNNTVNSDRYLKSKSIWSWGVSSERSVIMRESANISLQNGTQVRGYGLSLVLYFLSALEKQKVTKNSMFSGICLHIWGGILLVKTFE